MKTKTIMKVLTAVMVIAMIVAMTTSVFAISIPTGNDASAVPSGMTSAASTVISVVQFVCYAAAVIMLMVLGIKFVSASPDGKAEIKKSAVIYVVGALLVFFAALILGWIKDINFSSEGGAST